MIKEHWSLQAAHRRVHAVRSLGIQSLPAGLRARGTEMTAFGAPLLE